MLHLCLLYKRVFDDLNISVTNNWNQEETTAAPENPMGNFGHGINSVNDTSLSNHTSYGLGSTTTPVLNGTTSADPLSGGPGVTGGATGSEAAYAAWGAPNHGFGGYSSDLNVMYPFSTPSQTPSQYYPSSVPYSNPLPAVQTGGPSQNTGEQSWKFQVL